MPRVFPDTNVCYPISLLDLVLRLDEADLHNVMWTEDLLDELRRTWLRKGARSASATEAICEDIRRAFPQGRIARSEYAHLIADMPGPDPDDHVHAAAAVSCAPVTLLTNNVSDFPKEPLALLGVTVSTPDDYLLAILERHPDELTDVIAQMASERRSPPLTIADVVGALARAGAPRFAAALLPVIDLREPQDLHRS